MHAVAGVLRRLSKRSAFEECFEYFVELESRFKKIPNKPIKQDGADGRAASAVLCRRRHESWWVYKIPQVKSLF